MSKDQCEAVVTTVNPWSLGGKSPETGQCKSTPTHIVQDKDNDDRMYLCEGCRDAFKKLNGNDYKITKIRKKTP